MRKSDLIVLFYAVAIVTLPARNFAKSIEATERHVAKLLSKGDAAGAGQEIQPWLRESPDKRETKLLLAAALVRISEEFAKSGDRSDALALDRKALALDPDEAYWHAALARHLSAAGNTEGGQTECSLAFQLFPLDSAIAEGCGVAGNRGTAGAPSSSKAPPSGFRELRLRSYDTPPHPQNTPEPAYTQIARSAHYRGTANIWILVNAEGNVEKAEAVQPIGLGLDENAVRTIRTWTFEPARRNGKPGPAKLKIEVTFRLY